MTRIAFDTNTYRALTEANPEAIRIERAADVLILPVVVYAELLAGFEYGSRKAQNLALLERFLAQPGIELLEITRYTASFYARVYASVRARGKMIPQNDLWIAALCLEYDCPLFTLDAHFSQLEGLNVVQRLEDL